MAPGAKVPQLPASPPGIADRCGEWKQMLRRSHGRHSAYDPVYVQYWRFASGALRGDLGRSFRTNQPVTTEIRNRFVPTLILASAGMILAATIGLLAGVLAGRFHGSIIDNLVMVAAMIGVSMPGFWLGLMLIFLFAVQFGWFPVAGAATAEHVVLPSIALGVGASAILARMTRSSMLEVLRKDYVQTARAKGLSERVVIYKHVLKNSLIPVVTIMGLQFGGLLAGTVIIEQVFAWPGLGTLAITALQARDFPMVQGIVLYIATAYVLVNLTVDLLYCSLDPRIKYG
jgi:peptide/nickel transport system permease protein